MKLPMIMDGGLAQQGQWSDLTNNQRTIVAPADVSAAGFTLGTDNFGTGVVYARSGQTAAVTDTLPTGALMDTYYSSGGQVTIGIGESMMSVAYNNGAFSQTIAAGVGFTIVAGSDTQLNPGCRADILITRTGVNTWTYKVLSAMEGPTQQPWYRLGLATVGAGAITPTLLDADILVRTGPTAAYADTLPLGTTMEAFAAFGGMTVGTSVAINYSNQVAFACTITAAVGFTVIGNSAGVIAANSYRTALINKIAVNSYSFELL